MDLLDASIKALIVRTIAKDAIDGAWVALDDESKAEFLREGPFRLAQALAETAAIALEDPAYQGDRATQAWHEHPRPSIGYTGDRCPRCEAIIESPVHHCTNGHAYRVAEDTTN